MLEHSLVGGGKRWPGRGCVAQPILARPSVACLPGGRILDKERDPLPIQSACSGLGGRLGICVQLTATGRLRLRTRSSAPEFLTGAEPWNQSAWPPFTLHPNASFFENLRLLLTKAARWELVAIHGLLLALGCRG